MKKMGQIKRQDINRHIVPLLVFMLILTLAGPALGADTPNRGIKVYCNGDFKGSTAYVTDGVGMVPLALVQSLPGLRLDVRDDQAWFALGGRQLRTTMGSTGYTLDGQSKTWRRGLEPWKYGIAVPARDLFEALGATVRWDERERAIYLTVPEPKPVVPENLSGASLPLRLAFIQDEQLWLLDASKLENQPSLAASSKVERIIGWSPDGKWLAYLQKTADDAEAGSLWVVSSDGKQRQCLNALPFAYDTPVWSPTENVLVYQVQPQAPGGTDLWIAYEEEAKWQSRELVKSTDRNLTGLTWFPDGRSLIVGWAHDADNLPELERIDLQGRADSLFVLPADLAGNYADGMYIWGIHGLKLSPDGRYLACFLGMNSASLNADGMGMHLIDLQRKTSWQVGSALGYPEWLAWSPDSQKLAVILGNDRVASNNKQLTLVGLDENGPHTQELGETGQVDSRPFWSLDGKTLYFTRGQGSDAWMKEGRHQEVQVPGQQIFSLQGAQLQSLSQPGSEQADYPVSLSPDGKYLVLQRLDYVDQGAFYLMNLQSGKLVKIMDSIQAYAGYYGNYYPSSASVYWVK